MQRLCLVLAALAIASLPTLAQAKSACHIQGQVGGMVINECTETDQNVAADQLKQQCNGGVPGLAEVGGQADARVVAACPTGAGGVCENPRGTQARIYYYKRSAQELATVQQACQMQGGQWIKP
ncbi:hypothetical protein GLE_5279 [Lysobacter enzymogenes]|uniref:Uncharacterized protein n=1 Tax=Lysobacter enzymogenes TaxID=69 RepID=A0A0S2DPZ5_LYSEN|nr:hypothetical protein [Lysobacter enzymogenes]ALN60620.1 hypothetical protein GLE_5279 [Lysobacter enzymogenes]QCW28508.1 hypothetical protein FE772_25530 [Lysobacter enzymogenes]